MKNNIRSQFPILATKDDGTRLIYLDNAATSQKPLRVIDAERHFYTTQNANILRGVYHLAEQATQLYNDARSKVARFIDAYDDEIIFTSGTTLSINTIAHAWALSHLKPGDEIVLTELEHHANLLPWQWVAQQTDATLTFIPITGEGDIDYAAAEKIITSKTKLVSFCQVSNALGTSIDAARLINAAHAVGAYTLIDAAQSIGHQPISVKKLAVDFLAFSGHKMFGPTGVGVLYIHRRMHEMLQPFIRGGGIVESVDYCATTFQRMPHLLEAGTPPIAQAIGLAAAIDFLDSINNRQLPEHEASLCALLIDGLQQLSRVRILGPIEQLKRSGHIMSFVVDGFHPHDVAAYLAERNITVRAGTHCAQPLFKKLGLENGSIRASFHIYNSEEDVELLLAALSAL